MSAESTVDTLAGCFFSALLYAVVAGLVYWVASGLTNRYSDHCAEYPSAGICTAIYGEPQ